MKRKLTEEENKRKVKDRKISKRGNEKLKKTGVKEK